MELIDKELIIKELKRRIDFSDKLADAAAEKNLRNTMEANELLIAQYGSLLDFINTLETKEVYEYDEALERAKKINSGEGEQMPTYLLDNSESNVKFPFKAKVKSNGKIVTICGGQLSMDCKKWVKYQSNVEDGYTVYGPKDLELVFNIEQKLDDNKEKIDVLKFIRKETCCGLDEANDALLKLIKVLKERPLPIMDKPRKLKIEWE